MTTLLYSLYIYKPGWAAFAELVSMTIYSQYSFFSQFWKPLLSRFRNTGTRKTKAQRFKAVRVNQFTFFLKEKEITRNRTARNQEKIVEMFVKKQNNTIIQWVMSRQSISTAADTFSNGLQYHEASSTKKRKDNRRRGIVEDKSCGRKKEKKRENEIVEENEKCVAVQYSVTRYRRESNALIGCTVLLGLVTVDYGRERKSSIESGSW